MGKVSKAADLSRELRKALGNITQAELAAKLLVSRNYISQIEAELKQPSKRLRAQLEDMLTESAVAGGTAAYPVSTLESGEHAHSLNEPPATYRERDPEAEIRDHINTLIWAAKRDPQRLGWISEQLKAHLAMPAHWVRNEELNQRVHDLLRQRREEESGTELRPQHSPALHKKQTA